MAALIKLRFFIIRYIIETYYTFKISEDYTSSRAVFSVISVFSIKTLS